MRTLVHDDKTALDPLDCVLDAAFPQPKRHTIGNFAGWQAVAIQKDQSQRNYILSLMFLVAIQNILLYPDPKEKASSSQKPTVTSSWHIQVKGMAGFGVGFAPSEDSIPCRSESWFFVCFGLLGPARPPPQ